MNVWIGKSSRGKIIFSMYNSLANFTVRYFNAPRVSYVYLLLVRVFEREKYVNKRIFEFGNIFHSK